MKSTKDDNSFSGECPTCGQRYYSRRECTDGEWPCEMSTHLASLEAENKQLKEALEFYMKNSSREACEHIEGYNARHTRVTQDVSSGRRYLERYKCPHCTYCDEPLDDWWHNQMLSDESVEVLKEMGLEFE